MAEKSLERIERELEQAQRDHDKVVEKSAERVAELMAARDAKAEEGPDKE